MNIGNNDQCATLLYNLIVTAELNDVDPQAWLADVLARIVERPALRKFNINCGQSAFMFSII